MEMKEKKRLIIIEALDLLIEESEYEIELIKQRTETDYERVIRIRRSLSGKPFCLETAIQKDVEKVQEKIKVIKEVKQEVNDSTNRLLLIPNYIQLHLSGE